MNSIFNGIRPIGIIDSTIGPLVIFDLSLKNQIEIYNTFNNDLEKVNPNQFMQVFIGQACHKQSTLDEKLSKPKGITLQKNEINNLHFDDFENIAKLYLEKNEYLYKESKTTSKKDTEDRDVISLEYGAIIHSKKEEESYHEYLLRLMILEKKRNEELFRNSFGKFTEFSKSLQKSITQNLTIGDQLSKLIKSVQSINIPKVEPIIVKQPERDFSKLITPRPDLQLVTMHEVSSQVDTISGKLESLIEVSAEYVQFIIEANRIQTRIAEEVKKSSDSSTKFAKNNTRISVIVLIVAILSFIFGIISMLGSNKSNKRITKDIVESIDTLNKNISNSNRSYLDYNKKMNEIQFQLDSLKAENKTLLEDLKKIKSRK